MPEVRNSDHELAVCDGCGHEIMRAYRFERPRNLACSSCGSEDFTIFDALWIERSIAGDVVLHELADEEVAAA